MSQPIGANKDFIINNSFEGLQVSFIFGTQTLSFVFDDWLYQQLLPMAQTATQFNYCPGCGELLPRYLLHSLTGFCYSCRGDDDLM
ncbi:hypothetical protein [uncultured Microscilla sp.]|uniref:hypothetical protein n=1 Tax=uncultured Microscilla sp. TaxID=432653 RepID=UPI00262126AD|nr:hypothetical protein [uncultured Microscilla sp.]